MSTDKAPENLSFMTVDEVAECVNGIDDYTYECLWKLVGDGDDPTPLGGDGENGTVETPGERMGDFSDKLDMCWDKLPDPAKLCITEAAKHFGSL